MNLIVGNTVSYNGTEGIVIAVDEEYPFEDIVLIQLTLGGTLRCTRDGRLRDGSYTVVRKKRQNTIPNIRERILP